MCWEPAERSRRPKQPASGDANAVIPRVSCGESLHLMSAHRTLGRVAALCLTLWLFAGPVWSQNLPVFPKEEILLVLGTSSSEAALPKMMEKLEKYGCSKPVVGLVLPT